MCKQKDPDKLGKAEVLDKLGALELELSTVARWLQHTGQRLVVLIDGRDTAGKGGVISGISDTLNPGQCRVVALPKPSDGERALWFRATLLRCRAGPSRESAHP